MNSSVYHGKLSNNLQDSLTGHQNYLKETASNWNNLKTTLDDLNSNMVQIQRRIPLAPVQIYNGQELPERMEKTGMLIEELGVFKKDLDGLEQSCDELKSSLGLSPAAGVVDETYQDVRKTHQE